MRASSIMLVAVVLYAVHRWATDKNVIDPKTLVESLFAILVIAFLDQGKTEPIAKGFAWLFLAVAFYTAAPTITKAPAKAKARSVKGRKPSGPPVQAV